MGIFFKNCFLKPGQDCRILLIVPVLRRLQRLMIGSGRGLSRWIRYKLNMIPKMVRRQTKFTTQVRLEISIRFGGDYGFWFFLLTVLSFFMLVKMILFSTKYIFGIGILPQYKMLSDTELKGIITKSNRVYIAGLPGSGKSELFNRPFKDGVIPNFEMGINDHDSNQHKLRTFRRALRISLIRK